MSDKHMLTIEHRPAVSDIIGPGYYWRAWNERNGTATGGPHATHFDAVREGRSWEKDEFE